MPKRRERAAGYIRESNPDLAGTNTEESQAKAVRAYTEKEGYDYPLEHEYREAISAYMVDYSQRAKLMEMLAAAKRGEFDVLVVSEIRALGRKQVEVFVIYDMLQKAGVRLETIQEKFEDSAMGRVILSLRAAFAEIEREQTYMRTQRGRRDRVAGGAMNGHPKAAYGYQFIDTKQEQKYSYELNQTIVYVDSEGREWSECRVVLYIFELCVEQGETLRGIANILNDIGIPIPRKALKGEPHWYHSVVRDIIANPVYVGEAWANRYKKMSHEKTGKPYLVERPREEWIRLADIPALIDKETWEAAQKRLQMNKEDSFRNIKNNQELGILRAGFCKCGVCGRTMHVEHPSGAARRRRVSPHPHYRCRQKTGKNQGVVHNHSTQISIPALDAEVWEKVKEVLVDPHSVRLAVAQMRDSKKPVVDVESIEATILDLSKQIDNLFELAKHATADNSIQRLAQMMNELEKQKRTAEGMLLDLEEDYEEHAELEEEIIKFETWANRVRPLLTRSDYIPTYEEKRLAVRIIGIRVVVYPTIGEYPFRYEINVTVPEIMKKLKDCVVIQPSITPQYMALFSWKVSIEPCKDDSTDIKRA